MDKSRLRWVGSLFFVDHFSPLEPFLAALRSKNALRQDCLRNRLLRLRSTKKP